MFILGLAMLALPATAERLTFWLGVITAAAACTAYFGAQRLFGWLTAWYYYPQTRVEGERYSALVDGTGIEVSGDNRRWQIQWPGLYYKGEGKGVFILYDGAIIFIFAKRYLTPGQQEEFRRFAGLPAVTR
jgi:hypothetical protein